MAIYGALISAAAQILTSGKNKVNEQVPGTPQGGSAGGTAQSIFSQQQPAPQAQPLTPVAGDTNDQLATTLALLGDAPKADKKAPAPAAATPTTGNAGPNTPKKEASIGDILAASSQAIGNLAPLLFPQNRKTIVTGPVAGGQGGQLVQGFQLPQRQTLGQILAGLPR